MVDLPPPVWQENTKKAALVTNRSSPAGRLPILFEVSRKVALTRTLSRSLPLVRQLSTDPFQAPIQKNKKTSFPAPLLPERAPSRLGTPVPKDRPSPSADRPSVSEDSLNGLRLPPKRPRPSGSYYFVSTGCSPVFHNGEKRKNGRSTGARTPDQWLKRPLLYQLSYTPKSGRESLPTARACASQFNGKGV